MRLLALSGQRGAALAQYEACRRALEDELDVEPGEETTRLYECIRDGELTPPPQTAQARESIPPVVPPSQTSAVAEPPPPARPFSPPSGSLSREDRGSTEGGLQGERRTITALVLLVKGAAKRGNAIDVETWAEVMNQMLPTLEAEITRYGGQVDRYRDDGWITLFGVSTAHEDDPERAVLAALAIKEAVQSELAELAHREQIELALHAGINTGEMVVTGVGDRAHVWAASVIDGAYALMEQADRSTEPCRLSVAEETYSLVALLFEWETLGEIEVAKERRPIVAYHPLRHKGLSGKGRGIEGLSSPLVGREAEMHALQNAIAGLRDGIGGIATLVGEAGIGKSRLVAEIREICRSTNGPMHNLGWVEGRCLSYATSVAYRLWMDMLRWMLGMTPDAPPSAVRDALQEQVQALCPDGVNDVYPYLGRMMSLPLGKEIAAGLRGMGAQALQINTFRAVEALVARAARQRPLVIVCEDLHWADPTSLELLERLLALTDRVPLLFICVFRPLTEHGCWRVKEVAVRDYHHRHTDLWLQPLSSAESAMLVGNMLHPEDQRPAHCAALRKGIQSKASDRGADAKLAEGLPQELQDRVLNHAEGNPFYVEEILRSLIGEGVIVRDEPSSRWHVGRDIADIPIPDTLHGVIVSRIDRLPEAAKRTLQLASVIGRIFSRPVLEVISSSLPHDSRQGREKAEKPALDAHLATLQRAQMIRERARVPEREYIFKHHLTQDAAYNSLLKRERRLYHHRVAEALERLYSDRLEEQLGLLAHHWERAEKPEKAVEYLSRAGDQARATYANTEAIETLTRGLALLETVPESPEHTQRELDLLVALGVMLVIAKGHAAPEVGRTYVRARELCEQVGETPQRFSALHGVRRFYHVRGDPRTAHALDEQLVTLAQSLGDPGLLSRAHMMWGESSYWLGEFAQVREHCEEGLALYDLGQQGSDASLYGNDTGVACRIVGAWALWHLGYPDQALEWSREGLARAQGLSHPYNFCFAHCWDAVHRQLRREAQTVRERTEAVLRVSAEQGIALYSAWGAVLHGWALAEQGQIEGGIAQMRQGLDAWRASGAEIGVSSFLSYLAGAYGKAGRVQEGLSVLCEALDLADEHEDRAWVAELHRLKGELFLMAGKDDIQAEACFQRAIDVARRQRARSWELRAATSLSRLWHKQGKREEARKLLQGIYEWFTEGFDTADLVEAKALLDALA